jgi:hypothetical protein
MTLIHDTWATTTSPVGLELYYSGAWNDITDDLSDDGFTITRGRQNEGSQVDPARLECSLANSTGTYSPRNPNSTLYGLIGRNTPVRAYVLAGANYLLLDGAAANITTPDSAALSITSDIELQWDGILDDWTAKTDLISKYGAAGQRSFALQVQTDGTIALLWSADGTNLLSATSTQAVPTSTGRLAIKVTLDVNNGAAGKTTTFYTADSISGTWVQFGDPVTAATTTSIFDSTAVVTIGKNSNTSASATVQRVFEARIYNGIAGTLRAAPKASEETAGASTFADTVPITWTVNTGASITNKHYRFWGEVTSWPQKWGLTGAPSAYSPIECSGVMRRLVQGASPVLSPYRRGITAIGSDLVGYWPCEDAVGSTTLAAVKGRVGRVVGTPTFEAYSDLTASAPLPTLQSARFILDLEPYTNTDEIQARFLMVFPSGGTIANNTVLARVYTNNSLGWMDLVYTTASSGSLGLQPYTNLGVATTAVAAVAYGCDGKSYRIDIEAVKNGAGIDFTLVALEVGASSATIGTANVAAATLGSCTRVEINPSSASLGDTAVGHVSVEKNITTVFDLYSQSLAYAGETTIARMQRLATENGLTLTVRGDAGGSEYLGKQALSDVVDLMQEAAATDGGILFEPRTSSGLVYRTQEALYSQRAGAAITYSDNLLLPFEPVDDDAATRNKVTVKREGGTSATVEDSTSSMGTAAVPTGVGTYDSTVTLSLYKDEAAKHQAGWLVHLGTVDEARWPNIGINLKHPTLMAHTELIRDILLLDLGDRITVSNLPDWLPPFDVSQIVQGYTETITPTDYKVTLNCTPASPYRAAAYNNPNDRYGNENTTLAGTMTSTATSRTMTISYGPLWTTTAADFPFDIIVAGERMTVTNITGSSSPQTFTLTRSVNGVVKSHAAGEVVRLYDPVYYGL